MIIVFEGFDKSGKTTLKNEFNKATGYEHIVFDRGPWSCMFFDKAIRNNRAMYKKHRKEAKSFFHCVDLIVYVECSQRVAEKRLKEAKEEVPEYFTDYEENAMLFQNIVTEDYIIKNDAVIRINTDTRPMQESIQNIINKVEDLKLMRGQIKGQRK